MLPERAGVLERTGGEERAVAIEGTGRNERAASSELSRTFAVLSLATLPRESCLNYFRGGAGTRERAVAHERTVRPERAVMPEGTEINER